MRIGHIRLTHSFIFKHVKRLISLNTFSWNVQISLSSESDFLRWIIWMTCLGTSVWMTFSPSWGRKGCSKEYDQLKPFNHLQAYLSKIFSTKYSFRNLRFNISSSSSSRHQHGYLWPSLTTPPYRPLLPAGLLGHVWERQPGWRSVLLEEERVVPKKIISWNHLILCNHTCIKYFLQCIRLEILGSTYIKLEFGIK